VIAVRGNFDDAMRLVRELGGLDGIAIVNSINPYRIEGQKTAAFEIIEELGDAPDLHILPVGNAGNITAYWKGYREFHELARATVLPRMMGFQAAGSAPIFHNRIIESPNTVATAIRIGNPASWEGANSAVAESHGAIGIVTDEDILAAQGWLAKSEGIFVEPASAASVAGLFQLGKTNARRIVLTVTGHGLKDPDTAMTTGDYRPLEAEADLTAIRRVLETA
jgi:threonine synthase